MTHRGKKENETGASAPGAAAARSEAAAAPSGDAQNAVPPSGEAPPSADAAAVAETPIAAPEPPEAELQREAADVSAEIEALKDRLLRLQADFDNFRKRTARDRAEMCARATEDLVRELLPVLDHFEIGLQSAADHGADEAVQKGFRLVYDQLQAALAKFGVAPVDAVGRPFDAHEQEALAHTPSPDVPAGHVARQVRRGYRLGALLLRPAQVLISSGPPAAPAPES